MMSERSAFPILTWAQLIRLPAVFTAMSDIAMCACVAWGLGAPTSTWPSFVLHLLASSCVYCAGMILNDVADVDVDRRERSFRPIPSGRVARTAAFGTGGALLLMGLVFAALVRTEGSRSFVTCLLLVLAVIAYDFSPWHWPRLLLMPGCRYLNVMLGLSAASLVIVPWSVRIYLATVVAVYILGITLFARNEAGQSNPRTLFLASLLMALAIGSALAAPVIVEGAQTSLAFPYLILLLAWMIAVPAVQTFKHPVPSQVQATVRKALQGIIVLDAALACGIAGQAGLFILLLMIPNWYAGRWLSST